MTKISICVPTINPGLLKQFTNSISFIKSLNTELILICQHPVTKQYCYDLGADIAIEAEQTKPVRFVDLRAKGIEVATGDYILWSDDDHRYVPNSLSYISECIDYMENNKDVGSIAMAGYFGSVAWGDKIMKNPKSCMLPTDRGFILRNDPVLVPDENERNLLGLGEEMIFIFRLMASGYSHAKRFCCPNKIRPAKKINCGDISYSAEIFNQNIGKYIAERYDHPNWDSQKRIFPIGLIREQRLNRKSKMLVGCEK